MNRYKEGYLDVRNPFYQKNVSRIYFNDVDLIIFCTKNPIPILKDLKEITHPIIFHVTLTPYYKDIEPNVPPKGKINFKKWKSRSCNCLEMVDVGAYNCCNHLCKYCYANYDEDKVLNNYQNHFEDSSLIIGRLQKDDIIKIRQ